LGHTCESSGPGDGFPAAPGGSMKIRVVAVPKTRKVTEKGMGDDGGTVVRRVEKPYEELRLRGENSDGQAFDEPAHTDMSEGMRVAERELRKWGSKDPVGTVLRMRVERTWEATKEEFAKRPNTPKPRFVKGIAAGKTVAEIDVNPQ